MGKSKEELLHRLRTDPSRPPAVSSFTNLEVAEKTISQAIKANNLQIQQWSQTSVKSFLKIEYNASFKVGVYVKRGSTELLSTSKLSIILRRQELHGKTYYILTSFPIW